MASEKLLPTLPPPPSEIPQGMVPMKVDPGQGCVSVSERLRPIFNQMNGPRPGVKGKKITLLTNYFKVCFQSGISHLYSYNVIVQYENGDPVTGRNLIRKVIHKLSEIYSSEFGGQAFASDGQQSLFTVSPLSQKKQEFTVVLDAATSKRSKTDGNFSGDGELSEGDQKRQKIITRFKTFKAQINFVTTIPFQTMLKHGIKSGDNEVLRALDTILLHSNAKRNCLLVRQSYFPDDIRNFMDLNGGILGCRGFYSSFKSIQGGLYLNLDVSTTTIIQPGPVVNFLMANQNVENPFKIDWTKAKHILKNLRVKLSHTDREHKITGLSDRPCKEEKFLLRLRGSHDQSGNVQTVEVTVYDYFVRRRGIKLSYSSNLPCINVGSNRGHPQFIPIELCSLVSLQRHKKELSGQQKSLLLNKARRRPMELIKDLDEELKTNDYDTYPMLQACGISINKYFTQVGGRVLSPPQLRVGNKGDTVPRCSRWSFNDKKFAEPKAIEYWAVVDFSTGFNTRAFCNEMAKLGALMGMHIRPPAFVLQENPKDKKKPSAIRVDKMFEQIISKFRKDPPQFLLCFLPKKFSTLYGTWKKKSLMDFGIHNQCIALNRIDKAYLDNILLKINAKLGGLNFMLSAEVSKTIPVVSKVPTLILGMDVAHAPSSSDLPSVAAVVGSRQWPMISRYRASIRTQPPKAETTHSLFRQVSETEDTGMIRELLMDFYASSGQRKPAQIIIFRQGLSESQFKQLISEMEDVIKACKFLDNTWSPKFTLIVAQRRHHTKLFKADSSDNVPPGTVVDTKICHPLYKNNFYMCPHASRFGTSRPTHYFVVLDEIGFSSDNVQELVHCLCYLSQRCTSAIYEVAPIRYARLASAQMLEIMKAEGPQPPKLHKNISDTMFFC